MEFESLIAIIFLSSLSRRIQEIIDHDNREALIGHINDKLVCKPSLHWTLVMWSPFVPLTPDYAVTRIS